MSSEEQYLSNYSIENYERPSVTTDIVAFAIRSEQEDTYRHNPKNVLSLLLIKRGEHPFINSWALPGGFLRSDESIEECAFRKVTEETNVTPTALMLFDQFSEPNRDPRGRIISNAFLSIINEDGLKVMGGQDALEVRWFEVTFEKEESGQYILVLKNEEEVLRAYLEEKVSRFGKKEFDIVESGGLAFDHTRMIATALTVLRKNVRDFDFIFDFLPEKFTLTAVQKVQETITNEAQLPANFRRKISEYVVETEEYITGAGHRPAKLFKRRTN
ncbi:MAG: NUDIX hydrolase [Lachnospiraceae bacterium]|nr:NUDIX hydrolase [Lachnospiraceae bacterium]